MMHMRNSLIILIIAAFAMVSCKGFHDAELVEVNELLPVAENVVYVDAIGGPLAKGFSFIDPTVMIDDDGRAYLFYQGSPDGGKHWYLSRAEITFDGETPKILKLFNDKDN